MGARTEAPPHCAGKRGFRSSYLRIEQPSPHCAGKRPGGPRPKLSPALPILPLASHRSLSRAAESPNIAPPATLIPSSQVQEAEKFPGRNRT